MSAYVLRRLLYAVPILMGVNLITFALFFFVNTPADMARVHLGEERVSVEELFRWQRERNYHLPYFYNDGWTAAAAQRLGPGESASFAVAGRSRLQLHSAAAALVRLSATDDVALPADTGKLRLTPDQPVTVELAATGTASLASEVRLDVDSAAVASVTVRLEHWRALRPLEHLTATVFWQKSARHLLFRFGHADDGRAIGDEILARVGPSLAVTVPVFLLGLVVNITVGLALALVRGSRLDIGGVALAVVMMSVSILFYVIGAQWLLGKALRLVPVSGFDGSVQGLRFIILPVVIGVIGGVGTGMRMCRAFFLEEIGRDYVRTARAKGLAEPLVLYRHVLRNALIPILTGVIVTIPMLIIGSLILESFFAIPGMGSFTVEAIQRQDFAIVQAMVFLGSAIYVAGLALTDIAYTLVDPRIRLR